MNFLNKNFLFLLLAIFFSSQVTLNIKGEAQYNYFQDEGETVKKKKKKKKKKIKEDQEDFEGEEQQEEVNEEEFESEEDAPVKTKKNKTESEEGYPEEKIDDSENQEKIKINEPQKEEKQKSDSNEIIDPTKAPETDKSVEEKPSEKFDDDDPFEKENEAKKKKSSKKSRAKQAEKERKKQEKIVDKFLKDYKLIIPLESKFNLIFEGVMINEFFTGIQKNKNVSITEKFIIPSFGLGGEYQFFKFPISNLYMFFEGKITRGDMLLNLSFGGNKISNIHLACTSLDLALKTRWVFMLFNTYSNLDFKFGYLHLTKDTNANDKITESGLKTNPTSTNLFTSVFSDIFYFGLNPILYFSESFGIGVSPQLEWIPFFSEDPQFASGREVHNFGYSGTADIYFKIGNFTILNLFVGYKNIDSTFDKPTMNPRTLRSNVKNQELLINFIRTGLSLNFIL